jgi:phosphate transport system permease protein
MAPYILYMKKEKTTTGHSFADTLFKSLAIFCSVISFAIIIGIFISLVNGSKLAIKEYGAGFLFSSVWNPVTQEYGALSSIYGTLLSTIIAMAIAVPMSLVIALFLVELAPPVIRKFVGYAIELLAAIPSIIYGMWGLFVFAPFMAEYVQPFIGDHLGFLPLFQGPPMGIGMLTAGIILALMILPFVSAVMRDVFQMVPSVMKEAGYGMGATTWEVTRNIVVRYGIQGMIGASFIGLGRALGETMAVTFVIGNNHSLSASLFSPGNSIASTLANEFTEASEPLYLNALVELGLLLFVITFIIQIIAQMWLKRIHKSMGRR